MLRESRLGEFSLVGVAFPEAGVLRMDDIGSLIEIYYCWRRKGGKNR